MQPTAMERAEALPLLGFRRRAPLACPASAAVQRVCRERASKRWSALLTQTKSRIGHRCGMRKRLGRRTGPMRDLVAFALACFNEVPEAAAFVRNAEAEHKAQILRPSTRHRSSARVGRALLRGEARRHGTLYPNGARIDLLGREHHEVLARAMLPLGLGLGLWLWLWLG